MRFGGLRGKAQPYDWRTDKNYNPYYTQDFSKDLDKDNVDLEHKSVPFQCDFEHYDNTLYCDPGNPNIVANIEAIPQKVPYVRSVPYQILEDDEAHEGEFNSEDMDF